MTEMGFKMPGWFLAQHRAGVSPNSVQSGSLLGCGYIAISDYTRCYLVKSLSPCFVYYLLHLDVPSAQMNVLLGSTWIGLTSSSQLSDLPGLLYVLSSPGSVSCTAQEDQQHCRIPLKFSGKNLRNKVKHQFSLPNLMQRHKEKISFLPFPTKISPQNYWWKFKSSRKYHHARGGWRLK